MESRRRGRALESPESPLPSGERGSSKDYCFLGQGSLVSSRRARVEPTFGSLTGPPWARNASGRTSFSPARSCAAVHGTAMCPSDTDIDGDVRWILRQKHLRSILVTRRIDSTLAGESLRYKGADYATRRWELPTFVWSIVPPGLDSPPAADQTRSGPLLRQRGEPPDHRKPGRRAAASRRKQARRESSWRSAARLSPHGLTSPARTATMRRRSPRSASCQKPPPLGVFGYPMVSVPAPTTGTSRCTWTTGHRRCGTTEVHVREAVTPGDQGRTLCTRHARELEVCRRRRAARREAA
jgi:hypothetical protein